MGRPRGSGRGGYRGRGRGGAGRGALVAQNADPIPVSTVDGPASPDSASVNELPLNGASPIDTEAGNETAATSSSEVSASNSESVPAPVVRGRSKGGRPRGRGRGGRGRGTGTASKVVEEDISRPQTDEDRLSRGPPEKPRRLGLRGGRAYKTRRATEAQQILAMDWPASNPSDLLATADYSSFTLPEVNTQDRRGVLRAKRESQLANTTVDQLIERAEELRSFFNEGAKVLIDQNLIDAVHTVKSIDAMTPSEVQQMEWYRNVRKELEQSETDAIARLEQFFQTQMRSLDIMRDGQCEKLFESTSNRCYEAMDRAVLQFLRSGDSPLSEFFELIPPKFTEYVLSKTRHDKVEDVTRNDLIIYFESSEGNNRSKFDLPQVNTRSNRGLYDRKVLPTRGAILREKLAEHWDQIKHLFDLNGPDLPASELLHKAVQNPEKLPVDLLKAFEDYHGTALVALEWESKILRDQIREHWRELGHKFGPHNVDSLSPQQIVYVIQSHPDGVPKDIWSTINRYHDTIYPYAELTFTPVSKRPEMLELRETRPDYNLQKTTEIKRKRETEDANISKKRKMTDSAQAVQLKGKMAASPAQADRGRKRKYTEGETRPTTKIRRTAANRKTYIAFEIPEDCHDEGEDSDPEMQATYLGALFGGISAPLALVNDYHHDTRNHAQFRDPSIKTSHELRAAEGLTTIGMAAQRVTGTAGHQPSLTSLDDDTETMDSGGYSEDLEESDADNMDVEQYPEINIDEHAMVNGSAGFGRPVAIDKPSVSEEAIVAERPAIMPNGPVIVDKPVVINEQIPTSANGTTTENLAYEQEPIQSRILAEMENTQNRNNNGHSVRAITNKESNPESTAHRLRDRRPATNGVVSNGKNAVGKSL
ncbi:hypothetical protein FN846DRAFT_492166 [Sphaerosporella brunnea]|uniref:Uncharacterized protein n=1 Tax=Sphaerosporella brunnea TaxID=1250544 RepID=A0A5J5F3Y4_9PEZI|nr:hypothetical protein FN846DRAFT_492166 [Sphaerosporella brunnea]